MTQSKTLTTKIAVTLAAFLIGCAAQGTGLTNNVKKDGVKASFAPVTYDDILNDDKTVGDVVTYGLGQKGQRYSTLKQINKKSIKDLVPVWNFSFGGEKMRGQESQPLVKDGVMYVTSQPDAKSGITKQNFRIISCRAVTLLTEVRH